MDVQNCVVDFIPDELYASMESVIPIVCADFVLARRDDEGRVAEVGLIERNSPYGRVWCHLGGRIRRGETVRAAIQRHVDESLSGVTLTLVDDPQPQHVYQWFPPDVAPSEDLIYGTDVRKHAVGLSYLIDADGQPVVKDGGEALAFAFFPPNRLPDPMWPGSADLVGKLLARQ